MSSVFSILIATDTHLGYEETDPIIGNDSFITFEEILLKAVEKDVDLILLGGDLFHHNNPSQKCMNKCMELLRRYTLGDKPVYFELLSNASEVFCNSVCETTNYLDNNLNVSIPVFSIHGNHDDPSGLGHFSALDTLSSAGLVNYFGKWTNLQEVIIKPILLRKGKTKIALYGLSHIKDDRLCRLFLDNKVKFIRPEVEIETWFNIFILHQNRIDRGPKRFISETNVPGFIDLVIWGHEHDCEIEPIMNLEKGFYVLQPGSSVATSLSEGEAISKHIALLNIFEKKMKVTPLKLNTVRPFLWRNEFLDSIVVTNDSRISKSEQIKTHCIQIVEEMIKKAEKLRTGHIKQPILPLIRLRCDYSDETELFNVVKFGQFFRGRVANPNGEIIRLKRVQKKMVKKEKFSDLERLNDLYKDDMEESYNFSSCVNHIVKDYFTNHEEAKMLVLRVPDMGAAVEKFIDKDDIFAIDEVVDSSMEKILKTLKNQHVNVDECDITTFFEQIRSENEKLDEVKEDPQYKLEKLNLTKNKKNLLAIDRNSSSSKNKKDGLSDNSTSNSDTDEYNDSKIVESDDHSSGNKTNNSSGDEDFFGTKKKLGTDCKKQSGRGRGKNNRGRIKTRVTSQIVLQKKNSKQRTLPAKNTSVIYDSDSE